MSDLKPCPFCGGKIIHSQRDGSGYICRNCGTEGFGDWNTRPLEDALLTRALTAERELSELRERTRWIPVREKPYPTDCNNWSMRVVNGELCWAWLPPLPSDDGNTITVRHGKRVYWLTKRPVPPEAEND